jgi:hypothetical protein
VPFIFGFLFAAALPPKIGLFSVAEIITHLVSGAPSRANKLSYHPINDVA